MQIIRANNKTVLQIKASEITASLEEPKPWDKANGEAVKATKPKGGFDAAKRLKQRIQYLNWQRKKQQEYGQEDAIDKQHQQENLNKIHTDMEWFRKESTPIPDAEPSFNTHREEFESKATADPVKAAALQAFKTLNPEQRKDLYHAITFWDEQKLLEYIKDFTNLEIQNALPAPVTTDEESGSSINMQMLIDWTADISLLLEEADPTLPDQMATERAVRRHKVSHPSVL